MDVVDEGTNERGESIHSDQSSVFSRGNLLERMVEPSLGRRLTLASAAIFASMASRDVPSAGAANWICCDLAYPNNFCQSGSGSLPFTCPSTGGPWYKRAWYCCGPGGIVGCGECQSNPGTCHDGGWTCSYGWYTGAGC